MLDRNPKTRAGFKEILAHPVFAHLDWNRVASLDYTREIIPLFCHLNAVILIFSFSYVACPRGRVFETTGARSGRT